MKKFFAIALIAASFVACNEGEKKTETETPNADSVTNAIDSTATQATNAIDSTVKVADSTINAAVDSLKK